METDCCQEADPERVKIQNGSSALLPMLLLGPVFALLDWVCFIVTHRNAWQPLVTAYFYPHRASSPPIGGSSHVKGAGMLVGDQYLGGGSSLILPLKDSILKAFSSLISLDHQHTIRMDGVTPLVAPPTLSHGSSPPGVNPAMCFAWSHLLVKKSADSIRKLGYIEIRSWQLHYRQL